MYIIFCLRENNSGFQAKSITSKEEAIFVYKEVTIVAYVIYLVKEYLLKGYIKYSKTQRP